MPNSHGKSLQYLSIDGSEVTDKAFEKFSTLLKLKKLHISFCENVSDNLLSIISNIPSISHLSLRKGRNFTEDGLNNFFRYNLSRQIIELDLSECVCVTDKVVDQLVKKYGSKLRRLILKWCWNITERGLSVIINHCPYLDRLELTGVDQPSGSCLINVPLKMKQLCFLDLACCSGIDDNVINKILIFMPKLSVLDYYGVEFPKNSSEGKK